MDAEDLKDALVIGGPLFVRRLFTGPARPSWSYKYELVTRVARNRTEREDSPLPARRATFDTFGAAERTRTRAKFKRVDADGVPGVWVTPRTQLGDRVILYLHGGAYVVGSSKSHASFAAALAVANRCRVLLIDYRLAPEHRCPAAIDDAVSAYSWLLSTGVDPARIVFAGDSAGGGLAVATMLAGARSGLPMPAGAVLISPWVDLTMESHSAHSPTGLDHVLRRRLKKDARRYAGELELDDERVSPLFADLTGLPPLMILAGGQELILDDARALAHRAEEAGVLVTLDIDDDEVHAYPLFETFEFARPRYAIKQMARWIAR